MLFVDKPKQDGNKKRHASRSPSRSRSPTRNNLREKHLERQTNLMEKRTNELMKFMEGESTNSLSQRKERSNYGKSKLKSSNWNVN